MSPLRSLTVLLMLTVTRCRVDAFTIRRTSEDLVPAENGHHVKNELTQRVKFTTLKDEGLIQTIPLQATAKNVTTEWTTVAPTSAKSAATKSISPATFASTAATTVASTTPTTVASTTPTTVASTIPTTVASVATTIVTTNPPSTTVQTTTPTITTTKSQETTEKTTTERSTESSTETTLLSTRESTSETITVELTTMTASQSPVHTTTSVPSTKNLGNMNNTAVNNKTKSTTAKDKNENMTTVPPKELSAELTTEVNNKTSYSTEPVKANGTTITDTSSIKNFDGSSPSEKPLTTTQTIPSTSQVKNTFNWKTTETDLVTSETTTNVVKTTLKLKASEKTAEGLTGADSAVTATPYWKRYTMIDRKRLGTVADAVTSTEQDDLVKAGTAQSSISIAKALSVTSGIPSLDELKNEILALNNKTTLTLDKELQTEKSTTSYTKLTSAITTPKTEATTETTKLDIVSSKRAGFLDYSLRPTVETETTTVQKVSKPIEIIQKSTRNSVMQTTIKTQDVQRSSSQASQSQLAEDAINEELMKEETLTDNVNAKKQRDDILVVKAKESKNIEPPSVPDSSVEDKLSVKPISAEKIRPLGGLYTVSPNYKPLKKIEVQPPKPFVRNPDDNSWRNESLSSLGIVFKANNSSKPFTQVLKNKTETEWNALLERYSKGDEPELRERLEKIAEQRKSKKKKINQFGDAVYTDYEESTSGENLSSLKPDDISKVFTRVTTQVDFLKGTTTPTSKLETGSKPRTTFFDIFRTESEMVETTTDLGKTKKVIEDYESDDDEPDYTLANIDLKKFMTPPRTTETPAPARPAFMFTGTPTVRNFLPDRKPTIQYFPPREKQKVVVNDYDTEFQKKVNSYTYKDAPTKYTNTMPETVPTQPTFHFPKNKFEPLQRHNEIKQPQNLNKNIYLPHPRPVDQGSAYVVNQDGSYNRATYVIKHLRDFIDEVAKEDDHASLAATEVPRGVTTNEGIQVNKVKPPSDYFDYESQFKKDVLDRFVENFNQNSERFKADFPILYNTTVVHSQMADAGKQASSSAFMKRLYEDARAIQQAGSAPRRSDPNCDRTVELSPAYELHYYVPEEEEKEEFVPKAASLLPYRFQL